MFGKRSGDTPTIIGSGSTFEGTLRVDNSIHIEGTVEGDVRAEGDVSIGPDGKVNGTVTATSLAIAGSVEGTVRVRGRLQILHSGSVKGDAFYETLQVDEGGVVDGRTERLEASAELGVEASDLEAPEPDPFTAKA